MKRTVVCDIGCHSVKIGFAGSLAPERVLPNFVACPKDEPLTTANVVVVDTIKSPNANRHLTFLHPIDENGRVQSWVGLEAVLRHGLEELGVTQSCHLRNILVPKPYNMKHADLRRLFALLFFKMGFRAATMHEQAALVLYTQGVESGIVVEIGETKTTIVPVYKGHAIPKLDKYMEIGGRTISKNLMKLLQLRGHHLDDLWDLDATRLVKERLCYVALQPDVEDHLAENTSVLEETVNLRDRGTISIGKERYDAVEPFFQPRPWDSERGGLADVLYNVVQEADIDCRVALNQNILLSGGSTLLPGIKERLEFDLSNRYVREAKKRGQGRKASIPQVHAPESREYLVFEGAALFADLITTNPELWVTKSEFEQHGEIQTMLDKCQIC